MVPIENKGPLGVSLTHTRGVVSTKTFLVREVEALKLGAFFYLIDMEDISRFIQAMQGKTLWRGYTVQGARIPIVPVLQMVKIISLADVQFNKESSSWEAEASVEIKENGKGSRRVMEELVMYSSGAIYLGGLRCEDCEKEVKDMLSKRVEDELSRVRESCYRKGINL